MRDRVVDQDPQQLRDAVGVAGGSQRLRREFQLELGVVQRQCGDELGGDSPREHADVGRCGLEIDRARFEPREVEQTCCELAEPRDLLAYLSDELAPGLLVELLVLDQLEKAAEREDRRAQLVRGDRDESPPRVLELLQLALHVGERRRELPELVVRVDLELGGEVALRDSLGGALQTQNANRQRPRDEHAQQQHDGERDRRRRQDPLTDQHDVTVHIAGVRAEDEHVLLTVVDEGHGDHTEVRAHALGHGLGRGCRRRLGGGLAVLGV